MLRITTHEERGCVTFQLEGRLAGPWVQELENCWQTTLAGQHPPGICVDLRGVTSLDAAGKEFLAALHARGATFVAAGCAMKAVVAEVTRRPVAAGDCAGEGTERRMESR